LVATFVVARGRENVRAKEALLLMLVVNRREQLRPDGLSSRSRTVNSLHPRSPNIRVKFKLIVLSYHRKKAHAAANKSEVPSATKPK